MKFSFNIRWCLTGTTRLTLIVLLTTPWCPAQDADAEPPATPQAAESAAPESPARASSIDAGSQSDATAAQTGPAAGSAQAEGSPKADVAENPEADATTQPPEPGVTSEPEVEIPFKNLPYTVEVSIGFESHCLTDPQQREELLTSVRHAVARMYGRMWNVTVERNDWMVPASARRLEWLTSEQLMQRYPEERVHKAFLVTVEADGSSWIISCREFDSRIQELTPVYVRETYDPRSIPTLTAELLRDSFRPCVLYERTYQDADGRSLMEMQVQAGEILPPDPSAEQVTENDVLRPFVRQMDRRQPDKLDRLLRLDLSYIRVMAVDRQDAPGRLQGFFITHSPYSPFGGKGRRLQHLAVRQRPAVDQSKVRLILRGRPDRPLVSHRLALAYQLHWSDPEDGPQTQLVSDRDGEVVIERRENHPTFWIRVYSGSSLLARVPYAPGLIPTDTIELPDDSVRLGVEGEIQLLTDELVDAIALRSVLLARARKAAEKGDAAEVEALLEKFASVPAVDYFQARIKNIRIPAELEAKRKRLSTVFIKRLCDGLESSVTTFFSDERRREQQGEIDEIRRIADRSAAAAAAP
ncbi:MAG: hypothetical protein RIK87_11455 [Fuerstiella sp.]